MCGYNDCMLMMDVLELGSSPRVRVQLNYRSLEKMSNGIIPACAGTTFHLTIFERLRWDHPRVCGYNPHTDFNPLRKPGSSPRVRVQQDILNLVLGSSRIIPACAGTTKWKVNVKHGRRDHPRVCGYNCSV